ESRRRRLTNRLSDALRLTPPAACPTVAQGTRGDSTPPSEGTTMTPLRLAAAGLVLLASPSLAQAPAQAPAWAQGRPDHMANSPLAPHAPKMTVTPPNEVPLDRLRVPATFPELAAWEREHGSLLLGAKAQMRAAAAGRAPPQPDVDFVI
ncbi:MAG: hypothetical protein K6T74_16095, partial [Geminicoccaceae bacterium]|nr:hypothetical protein [Geminicoccaceae bacterium]